MLREDGWRIHLSVRMVRAEGTRRPRQLHRSGQPPRCRRVAASGKLASRHIPALAALIFFAACGGPEAHRDSAALRADSSAAGYAVGVATNADSATRVATTLPVPAGSTRHAPARNVTPTVPGDSGPARAQPSAPVVPPPPDRPVVPRDTTRPILIARVRVNEYLEYNSATRTAYVDIVATRAADIDSLATAADTLAFNNSRSGDLTISVPLGWQVVGQFVNRDPVLRHSAIVIEEAYPLPMVPPPAAFPQAFTRRVDDGLARNVRDEIAFTASREGRFLIVCGVPGHAEGGQRMQLVVTPDIDVPAYGR